MSCAEVLRYQWIQQQREKARGRRDAIAAHDDSSIMKWRRWVEQRNHQIVTELRVQLHTGVNDSLQANTSLDHYQRPRLGRRQRRRGQNDLIVDGLSKLSAMP